MLCFLAGCVRVNDDMIRDREGVEPRSHQHQPGRDRRPEAEGRFAPIQAPCGPTVTSIPRQPHTRLS